MLSKTCRFMIIFLSLFIGVLYAETMSKIGLIGSMTYSEPGIGIKYNFNRKVSSELLLSINYQKYYLVDTLSRKSSDEEVYLYPNFALHYDFNTGIKPDIFTGLQIGYSYDSNWWINIIYAGIPIGVEYFIMDNFSAFVESGLFFSYNFKDYFEYSLKYRNQESMNIGLLSTKIGLIIYVK